MPLRDAPPLTIDFKNFMKGHISRLPVERIPIDGFLGQNISLIENFVPGIALGQVKYNTVLKNTAGTTITGPVRGGCTYIAKNGTKYYVMACGGYLWYSIAGSGTFSPYRVLLTGGSYADLSITDQQTEFAEFEGNLYVVTGNFPVILNTDGTINYANSRILVIQNTEVHFIDNTELAVPSGAQYIWVDKQRLFAACTPTAISGLFWTNSYFLYTITPGTPVILGTSSSTPWTPVSGANYDTVGEDDGESITAIFPYQNNLIVFKPRNVYTYSTIGDITNWGSVRVDTTYGCPFNRTIKEMEGYLYWLSYDGIVQFDGTNANLIDDNIRPDILAIPQLASSSRQWVNGTTTDFNLGTFGADLVDTSGNELQQNNQQSSFASGTFGGKVIAGTYDTTQNIRLMAQILANGAFTNTLQNPDGTVVLQTTTYPVDTQQYVVINASTMLTGLGPAHFLYNMPSTSGSYYYTLFDTGSTGEFELLIQNNTNASMACYHSDVAPYSPPSNWIIDPNIPHYSDEILGPGDISLFNAHRYWILVTYYPSGSSNPPAPSPTFTGVYVNQVYYGEYLTSGSWVSPILDFGLTPQAMGILSAVYSAANGTTLTFQVNTSPNADMSGSTGWQTVTPGSAIPNTTYRYAQIQVLFTSPAVSGGATSYTPVLNSIYISAPFQSKILDYGFVPATFGTFSPSVQTPSDSSITWCGRSSSHSDMSSPTAWIALTPGAAVPVGVTLNRYFQWYALLNPSSDGTQGPEIDDVFIAGQWDSAVEDLGAVPSGTWQWGKFTSTYGLNAQTITFWLRSGTTSGNCLAASWVQQTPGTPVTGVTLNRYLQVEIRFDTDNAAQIPAADGFNVTYYTGANLEKPCAYVLNKEYCLNVTDAGQTINNIVWRYSSALNYYVKRTNKCNNVYFLDEGILLSGASTTEGVLRINETGHSDDGVAIDAWLQTKNIEQIKYTNYFDMYYIVYSADQPWTFSYSLDGGSTWNNITVPASSSPTSIRKTLPGRVMGDQIQLMIEQSSIDASFQLQEMGIEYHLGFEKRND